MVVPESALPAAAPIPVTIVGGYLGAGKTTLVNSMLRQAKGLRLAVLVNDFGDIAIDADLIEASDDDLLQLAGGCVCCSVGSDLVSTLMALPGRMRGRPDHVLLETSGVALPGMVAATLSLVNGIRRDGVIVLADALHLLAQWRDHYLEDTIDRQLAAADLVVLGKCDLVDAKTLDRIEHEILSRHPMARLVRASRGDLPIELVLGVTRTAARSSGAWRARPANDRYASLALRAPDPVDAERLVAALAAQGSPVLRAKGFVRDSASSELMAFDTVAGQVDLRRFDRPTRTTPGRFIVIGERSRLDGVRSIAGLEALGVTAS